MMGKLGKLWDTQTLKEKLIWLVIFHIIVFMSFLVGLNGTVKLPTVNNGDISGWYSLLISSISGSYITFAILIYSNESQKKIADMITDQYNREKKRKNFAIEQIKYNLSSCKSALPTRSDLTTYDPAKELPKERPSMMTPLEGLNYASESLRNTRVIINLYSEVLEPDYIAEIIKILDYSIYLSNSTIVMDDNLLNLVDGLHEKLDAFFKNIP